MTEESEDEAEANDLDNEVNNTAAAGPCIHGLDANEIVSALDASAEGYTNQDRNGDLQGDAEDPQPTIRRAKRGRKKCTETHSQKKSSSTFQARSTEAFQNTVEPTYTVGPTFLVSSSPAEVLSFLFVNELVETIVDETNMYAERMMEPAKFAKWKQVDMQEIKAYLGFNMLMGLVQMPEVEDYWKTDPHFYYAPIATRISRTRFKEITRYLHFTDNTSLVPRGQRGHDKLGKVRPVITAVSSALLSSYNMGKECVVDEAMIAFQGRWCLKQYLPKKPIKRGIKAWCLADSSNGYIQKFEVYTGRNDTGEQENVDVAVLTGTWGGDSQGTGQEMWQYVQEPEEETVRALARRCGSMYRDLGRRQSGHWPGNVAVLTGTWGGDSQGTGPEMWQYVQEPEEETVRALARRCGSTHRDLGRRQSGHWPGDVAVCTGTWGGDSQDTGQEMWQYSQGPGEETVRALARRCGSMYRDLKRRQSGHWPGDVAVCTGTWGGDSQDTGQEMWQYSQGPGEETVRALARRCGSMYRNLKRRQSGHWPGDVAVCTGTWGGDSQGPGQ
eukprot:Em0007g1048a